MTTRSGKTFMLASDPAKAADYVIVGAGSAGAVVANRLSANPDITVILIEAGGEANSFLVRLPVGFAKMIDSPKFDWRYRQQPDSSIKGRSWVWSAGRMLGGGSSINGQVFIRGTRDDFDRWERLGATGWGFNDVFPYFLRSEDWRGAPSQAHGSTGPLTVTSMRDPHPLCQTFLRACGEIGLPTLDDYNGGENRGAFLSQTNQRDGWRCSTERAFLRPIRKRPNLEIVTQADVRSIRVRDGRAIGVTLVRDGQEIAVDSRREVIVSAGAIGTPALLMRSGIGPAAHLRERGVEIVRDSPDVGRNLQEHPAIGTSRFVTAQTLNTQLGPVDMIGHFARFLWNRSGPLGAPAVQAMAFARTRDGLTEPDVQLHFSPLASDYGTDTVSPAAAVMAKEPAVTIHASICQPRARGRVELDSQGQPAILHQLVGDDQDVATLIGGMKLAERLFATRAFAAIDGGARSPAATSDEDRLRHIRANGVITWHPVGTCRMGSDDAAVVDPALRVRGIASLRVVDASVMPTITSSNTNAPTIMIGEKASEMILADR